VAGDSSDVDAINTLAILSEQTRNRPRAEQLYRRALVVEAENGIIFGNLVGVLTGQGKFDAADSVLRVVRARKIPYPIDRSEADLLYIRGEIDSAEARARVGMKSSNAGLARSMTGLLRQIGQVRGRLHESDSIAVELRARNAARGAPVSPIGIAARQALDDAWLRGQSQHAIARLDSALRSNPLGPEAPAGQWLDAANTYAMAGAPDRARSLVGQYDAAARDSVDRQSWRGQRLYVEGSIALAEKRTDEAIRTFRRMDVDADGLAISCAFCLSLALSRAYDQANNADSTIAYLERYLGTTITFRINPDTWLLGPAHKRLGELYEARGDNKKAAEHYAAFVELWNRADPDLQPKVAEARTRLERVRRALPR
jgi:eukaryotic-like serine/threonine-protein kinase